MLLSYKKIFVLAGMAGLTLLGIAATKPPQEDKIVYKNLQVLSKKISRENMEEVMDSFNNGLGVNCIFCHPSRQAGTEYSINYETDSMLNKRVARDMLRMTIRLNKKYFKSKTNVTTVAEGRVTCKTCHRKSPVPILVTPKKS